MVDNMQTSPSGTNKNVMVYGLITLLVVAGAIYLFAKNGEKQPVPAASQENAEVKATGELKVFEVSAKPFSFSPSEIRVKKGDTVKIMLTNTQGVHDLVLDEFNVRTPVLQVNGTAELEFVVDKTGTFEYYCSVGNHRQMGMVGKLIVE